MFHSGLVERKDVSGCSDGCSGSLFYHTQAGNLCWMWKLILVKSLDFDMPTDEAKHLTGSKKVCKKKKRERKKGGGGLNALQTIAIFFLHTLKEKI